MSTIFRQIKKNKGNTIINVLGLSLGITCALVLFLMIQHSTGFDNYHTKGDRVYRVVSEEKMNGKESFGSGVPVPFIRAFREEFPQTKYVVPVNYMVGGRVTTFDEDDQISNVYEEHEGVVYLDENFYKILDRDWLAGDPETSLQTPGKVVLSERIAEKYFHSFEIIGKNIKIDGVGNLEISGIIEDYPRSKTDFPFEIIISYKTFEGISQDVENWGSIHSDFQCYILVENKADVKNLEQQLPAFVDKYYGADRTDQKMHLLQPLSDLHFNQSYSNYSYKTISKGNIWAMGILGFFLIITACINFVNLSTAQASQRFREVAIRKVLGSGKWQIITSFYIETTLITFMSLLLAIGFSELALIKVNEFLNMELSIELLDPKIWIFLITLWIGVSFVAGFYPAYVISRFQPSSTLRGIDSMEKGVGFFLRKALVIFQFTVSQILIIGTIITSSQLNFFKNMQVGFKKEGIINIEIPENTPERKKTLKTRLAQLAESESVSLSYKPPASTSTSVTNVYYQKEGIREEMDTQIIPVDEDFIDVFEISLVYGQGLVRSDTFNRLVVNEAFVRQMGYQTTNEALGEMIDFHGGETPIIGIVKDFHTFSIQMEVRPVVLYTDIHSYETASVRYNSSSLSFTLSKIENVMKETYPGYDFNYSFMDEQFARFYEGEQKMSDLLRVFSGIAIFIGCLGLFGLVAYMANKRSKEIGIRKVLGASVPSVVYIFSREFGVLVLIAFLIASPISYFGMKQWLQSYAYKIDLSISMFLLGVSISMGIALLTIAYKSIEASLANPVDVLKDE